MPWTHPKERKIAATFSVVNQYSQKIKIMERLNTLIQNETELEILVRRARQTDAVALDTEFVWERTYYPQLGLIQLGLSDEECFLIDPLALSDLQPLGQLLSDRGVVKILHDAPQDLAILHRATGATPQNIFDTKLAAGFSNLPATLSLSSLVKELLEIDLPKDETRTNWLQRPLTDEQIRYALDDVRYLRAIRVLLLSRIIGPKIRSWLQEDLNLLNNPATYSGAPADERYMKIRNCTNLDRTGLAILMNLTIWRDGMAQKLDRPRGHIVKDAVLLEIARKRPRSIDELKNGIEISDKAVSKYGSNIIAIIETTLQQPKDSYPTPQKPARLGQGEREAVEKLNNLIQLKAGLLGIAPGLVGNTSELKLLVKMLNSDKAQEPRQLRQTEGWRKSFLEDFFRQSRK